MRPLETSGFHCQDVFTGWNDEPKKKAFDAETKCIGNVECSLPWPPGKLSLYFDPSKDEVKNLMFLSDINQIFILQCTVWGRRRTGEFWSTTSSLEIVTSPAAEEGQAPGEARPDQPGIRSRPVLLAGLAVLLHS
jgi:hypothetical protein